MNCQNCGAPVPDGAKFCMKCGTQVAQPAAAGFCQNCGQELSPGAAFCENCGASVSGGAGGTSSRTYVQAPPPQTYVQAPPLQTCEQTPPRQTYQQKPDSDRKSGKTKSSRRSRGLFRRLLAKLFRWGVVIGGLALGGNFAFKNYAEQLGLYKLKDNEVVVKVVEMLPWDIDLDKLLPEAASSEE